MKTFQPHGATLVGRWMTCGKNARSFPALPIPPSRRFMGSEFVLMNRAFLECDSQTILHISNKPVEISTPGSAARRTPCSDFMLTKAQGLYKAQSPIIRGFLADHVRMTFRNSSAVISPFFTFVRQRSAMVCSFAAFAIFSTGSSATTILRMASLSSRISKIPVRPW